MNIEALIKSLSESTDTNPVFDRVSKPGLCREWTLQAIAHINNNQDLRGLNLLCDAREILISPGHTHTFLRIVLPDETVLLWDGVGVGDHQPYLGAEEEAPAHLKDSRSDQINLYLNFNL